MKLPITLFILSIICFWACNTAYEKNGNLDPAETAYSLQIIDSIQVDLMLGYAVILAIHPENGNMLIYSDQGSITQLYDIDKRGNVVKSFDYPKDGPASAGAMLMSGTYFKDGFALMGIGYITIYDKNFEPKKKIRLPMSTGGIIQLGAHNLQPLTVDGSQQLLFMYGPDTKESNITEGYYEEYNMLSRLDPETEEFYPYGKFHNTSKFKSGRAFFFLRPFFQTVGNQAKVLMDSDTVLYTFDQKGIEINRKLIPFDRFISFKGYTLSEKAYDEQLERSDRQGTIISFWHTRGLDIIQYTSGLSLAELEALMPRFESEQRQTVLREVDPRKVIILRDGKRVSEDLRLPNNISMLGMADPDGFLWATQNVEALDEEPSVLTLYKLEIQSKTR
jgi:hypothetical protein